MSTRVYWWFRRWYYTIRFANSWAQQLNRRVEVENVLLAIAAGKRDPLTRDECRALAYKLGTPQ